MKRLIKNKLFLFKKIISVFNMIVIIITIILNIGCNNWNYISNSPNVEQGTYLTSEDIQKICIGATKTYIFSNIGPPTLHDLFGRNQCYYIYSCYNKKTGLKYQTVELLFNSNDILVSINIL